ncbi:MAG TPA: TonB-dependent receptor [Burkholderiaceae bacterium]|nr:TonB-dependent receptor [Burkholderiaceae bacterium]
MSLDAVTVTAAREEVRLDDVLQDVTVIDRATIEKYSGATLESLLAAQGGLQVSTNGGIGAASSVFMRGANSDSTLLLIDGMRYGSASLGGPVFYNLPLESIDHIEIVRGPMSSLYGSDAAGGVIQVFTKRGEAGFHPSAAITAGSEDYRGVDAGARGAAGLFDYALQLGGRRTEGYPATNAASFNYNPNPDGFDQASASANLGYAIAPGWDVRLQSIGVHGNVQFADGFDPTQPALTARSRLDTSSTNVHIAGAPLSSWTTTLRYGLSRDNYDTDVAVNAFDLGRFTTVQRLAVWQNDIALPVGTLLASIERLEQSVESDTTAFLVDHRTVDGLALGWNAKSGPAAWQVNGRVDHNSEFGVQRTGAASYGYEFAPGWRAIASVGTSFVMPSFDELYYPGFGNPGLRPQHGTSDEVALAWQAGSQRARLAVYRNRFRDLIAYVVSGTNYLPENVGVSRILGATLEYGGRFGPLDVAATLDVMDPDDVTDGTQLARRSRRTFSLKADWDFSERWAAGADLRGAGRTYDDTANLQPLGGYGLVAARTTWTMDRNWQLALRVDNLTNHHIQTVYGYDAPPRQAFLTLRYGGF